MNQDCRMRRQPLLITLPTTLNRPRHQWCGNHAACNTALPFLIKATGFARPVNWDSQVCPLLKIWLPFSCVGWTIVWVYFLRYTQRGKCLPEVVTNIFDCFSCVQGGKNFTWKGVYWYMDIFEFPKRKCPERFCPYLVYICPLWAFLDLSVALGSFSWLW